MLNALIERYPILATCRASIAQAADAMIACYQQGGKVLLCGNGGSCADSDHIVGELMKGFLLKRPVEDERIPEQIRSKLQGALPAISLPSQSAVLSAYANDIDPEMVYAQLVYGYAKPNDLVVGISTSGNSKNVVNAMLTASAMGVRTLALTGKQDSRLSEISNITVQVPETETYKVQELHLPVYHFLCAAVEAYFFQI